MHLCCEEVIVGMHVTTVVVVGIVVHRCREEIVTMEITGEIVGVIVTGENEDSQVEVEDSEWITSDNNKQMHWNLE